MTATSRRAAVDVAAQLAGRIVNLALGIAITLVVVRALGDAGFGQWATILAVTQIAAQFADLGLEQVAVRKAAQHPEEEASVLGALATLRFACAIPTTVAVAGILWVLAPTTEMRIAGLISAGALLLSPFSALRAVFQLRTRNDVTTSVSVLNSVLWTGAGVAVAATGGGVVGFMIALTGAQLVTTLLIAWLAVRRARIALRGSTAHWRALARVGLPVGIANLLTLAYVRIDQVLVFKLAGEREAGFYGVAYRILDQAQFVPMALLTTLFPILAGLRATDPDRMVALLQRAIEYLAAASLPALAFTIVASEPVIRLLFGAEFAPAAAALPILMGAYVSICFGYLSGNMVIILELQLKLLVYAVVALAVNITLNVVLIPPYGFVAAAWATLATELLVGGLAARAVLRALGTSPRLGGVLRIAAASAGMAAAVAGLRAVGAPVGVLLVAAPVIYGPLLVVSGGIDVAELRALLRNRTVASK